MILVVPYLFKLMPSYIWAMTIWPFILLKDPKYKVDELLIRHESIHLKQQKELLWLGFMLAYLLEFICRLIQKGSTYSAYRSISFEKEAFANRVNPYRLQQRPLFNFRHYFQL